MLRPIWVSSVCSVLALSAGYSAFAETPANNSKVNSAANAAGELNAQDQGTSKSDVELTRKIRKAVVAQDALSVSAKNIKIITINGIVTLKGPVKSESEKNSIQKIAAKNAGRAKVVNEISIE